jgi:serine/threonine protein phosphatase PrpC
MAANAPDPTPRKTGGLWARLFGVEASEPTKEEKAATETPPAWDASPPPSAAPAEPAVYEEAALAATGEEPPAALPAAPPPAETVTAVAAPLAAAAPAETCPICQSVRKDSQPFCDDCGYMYGPAGGADAVPVATPVAAPAAAASANPDGYLKGRYQILGLVSERAGISRFHGRDLGGDELVPVVIVRAALPAMVEPEPLDGPLPEAVIEGGTEEECMPTFEEPLPVAAAAAALAWPGLSWEKALLEPGHSALPRILDAFSEGGHEYLIEELPRGQVLWNAWDEPGVDASVQYGWLKQIAEGLEQLHKGGALIEGLRPDNITVTDAGQAMIADLSGLLPFPVPPGTPVHDNLYTAPELLLSPQQADARADLYSLGAILYSLVYLGHALEEKDFEKPFSPHQITDRYPDAHPGLCRLLNKTFCRDLNTRFPTDEAGKEDPSGFREVIRTLEVCQRNFDRPRMDVAAWTTTGMVRTGNEDAFAFLHAVTAGQDDLSECCLVLLCDGMGGYEAGEVAAAMAIASLRKYLLDQPMFAALAGKEPPPPEAFNVDACKRILKDALRYANKEVYTASRAPGTKRRGMGCTAEAVYIDPRNVVVGHVGDSRTYHLHGGRLQQLTRDQTLVNRLVELGQLTEAEAEDHPRKNELQQAIGGQPDVEPGAYTGALKRGDWVLVCSDGLTNHVPSADIEKMLLRETAGSAEEAARRFLNLVNLRGATDNATVVVVRAV